MKLPNLFAMLFIVFCAPAFAETPLVDEDEAEISDDEEEGSEEVEFEVRAVFDFPPAPHFDENDVPNYEDDAPDAPRARRFRATVQDNRRVVRRRIEPVANAAALQAIAQAVALIPPPPVFAFGANVGTRTLF